MRKQMEKQALAWDEGEYSNRGLCILVFRNVFGAEEVAADPSEAAKSVERFIVDEAAKFGTLEKVTMFSAHRDGVVLVKFQSGYAAETCRQEACLLCEWTDRISRRAAKDAQLMGRSASFHSCMMEKNILTVLL